MPLRVVATYSEELVSTPVRDALLCAVRHGGRASVLTPTFAQALLVQRSLASTPHLGMGIEGTTPSAWLHERWEVWGDGSHIIDDLTRQILIRRVIAACGDVTENPGTVQTLCDLVRRGLPWLRGDSLRTAGSAGESLMRTASVAGKHLTRAERDLIALAIPYAVELRRHRLIEECEAMVTIASRLHDVGVSVPPIVLVGFDEMPRSVRELVLSLSGVTEVTLVIPDDRAAVGDDGSAAGDADAVVGDDGSAVGVQAHALAKELCRLSGEAEIDTAEIGTAGIRAAEMAPEKDADEQGSVDEPKSSLCVREPELQNLLDHMFVPHGTTIDPTGAVSLILPAGALAEAEAICEQVCCLAEGTCEHIVITASNVQRMWRELAVKLATRGLGLEAQMTVRFADLEAGRAFLQFVRTVAHLSALDATWPPVQQVGKDAIVSLADMSWWPPRDLSDFLLSDIAHVPAQRAFALDRAWRSNRLLTPHQVLDALQAEGSTSVAVAQATRELLRGRIGSAASRLLTPYLMEKKQSRTTSQQPPAPYGAQVAVQFAQLEAEAVLQAVLGVSAMLKERAYVFSPEEGIGSQGTGSQGTGTLDVVAECVCEALENYPVTLRPRIESSSAVTIRLLDESAAAHMDPHSADALVICGLTADESPLMRDPSVAADLLELLDIESTPDPLLRERTRWMHLLSVPRKRLVLERRLATAEGKEAYSSVMLIELMACYGIEAGERPRAFRAAVRSRFGEQLVRERVETSISKNCAPSGHAAEQYAVEVPSPAGVIDPSFSSYVCPSPDGTVGQEDDRPLLSASQIETYLECPYKWFSLRRLRLSDADAQFSAAEMGTFVHRVLEMTHNQLLTEAAYKQVDQLVREALSRGIALPPEVIETEVHRAVAHDASADTASLDDAIRTMGAALTPDELLALVQNLADVRLPGSRIGGVGGAESAHASELLNQAFNEHLAHQYLLERGHRPQLQALVPHDALEEGRLDALPVILRVN